MTTARKTILAALLLAATFATTQAALAQTHLSGNGPFRIQGVIQPRTWQHYTVDVENHHGRLSIDFGPRKGRVTVLMRRGATPTLANFDAAVNFPNVGTGGRLELSNTSNVRLTSGRWHLSLYSSTGIGFNATIERRAVPSHVPGMGAIPVPGGTSFRAYTPHATVNAAGQFNNWNPDNIRLQPEGANYHSIFVRGATPGQQYKFVLRNGNQTLWRNDPYARQVTNSVGNSVIYDQNAFPWQPTNFNVPTWDRMVIYQMHIGTFNDLPGGGPGTFDSAIDRLDYLQDLGVNMVKLLPVQEFAGDFSWGYNPAHQFAVESAYGGPDNLKRFVNEAQKRGIGVILDIVHNHYGPSDLDLWRWDGWFQGNWGGLFFYNDDRAITPWGDTRPDYGRGFVRQFIRDNALMWLEDFRVDGFRWDSTSNIRRTNRGDNPDGWSLMQWLNNEIDARQPWKISIAEDLQGESWITRPTNAGGAGFDSQWSPSFVHPLRPLMTTPNDGDRNMNDLVTALTQNYNGNWLQRVVYTESHDEVANGRARVPQEIDPANPGSYWARKRSTLGAIVTFTAPGIPMIFQGQEILEDEWFRDTDPIDWSKATTFAGIRQLYKDLIRLRLNRDNFSAGLTGPHINLFHVNHGAKVAAYHRWRNGGPGDDVVVLINFSNTRFNNYTIGLPRGGTWNVVFNSDWNGYSPDFQNTFAADANAVANPMHGLGFRAGFDLGPYTALVLVQRP